MRNFTVIALGMALLAALPAGADTASPLKILKSIPTHKSASAGKKFSAATPGNRDLMKISEIASKLKPTMTKSYFWTGENWELDETNTFTYDASGNIAKESGSDSYGDYVSIAYNYDANGKVTYEESKVSVDGVNYENYKKTEFEYDPILTNVITRRTEWLWMDSGTGYDWQLVGNNYKRTITRNEDGNITSVVISVLFQGDYDPTQRVDMTYGEDGKATSICEQALYYDGNEYLWEEVIKISDIKWKDTDGQIYDPELLFQGNNRISSAHYEDQDDISAEVSVEYADDSTAYTTTMQANMEGLPVTAIINYTPLENDGYMLESTTSFMDMEQFSSKEEVRYDEWGHLLLSYEEEAEEDEIEWTRTVGTVEYDDNGIPASYTVSEEYQDFSTDEVISEYMFRIEYFDYVDVTTSVGDMGLEMDTPVSYYNLQGLPVSHLAEGEIVIKKQGKTIKKIRY